MQKVITKPSYAYGKYEVAGQQYLNKTDALVASTKLNAPVHWNFHDEIYSMYDWSIRPHSTLKELYRLRAQQIRDNYDYVIVHFSGGADSWTVLHSFLSNGIHVDEVVSRWAFDERKYKDANNIDQREFNVTSEYEFAALPVLKEIEKRYPQTHIHIDDYSKEYQNEVTEGAFRHSGLYTTLGTFYRFSRKSPYEQAAAESGKRIAVVYGFDKIQYCTIDNNVYAYFVDRFGGTDLDPARNVEAFYWSPLLPEIPILQAHEMKSYYEKTPSESLNYFTRVAYVKTCYPDYNINTFQVGKPLGSEIWQSELWIHKHNPRYVQSWQWALKQYTPNIDPVHCEYLSKFRLGYKTNRSNLYYVGKFNPEPQNTGQ